MKSICFCLLLCSLLYINTSDICESKESGVSSSKDCKDLQTTKADSHCCFIDQEMKIMGMTEKHKACIEVTKAEYDDIKAYIKAIEEVCKIAGSCKIHKLDCKSSYLAFSLLSLILLIL